MARIKLDLPAQFPFRIDIQVRDSDMNRGGHLGNDVLFSFLNEARVKFYASLGYSEENVEGASTIMSDAVIVYKAKSFAGDMLHFEVTARDFTRIGCDLFYRVTKAPNGTEVARAKTAIGFVDHQTRKVCPVPDGFKNKANKNLIQKL